MSSGVATFSKRERMVSRKLTETLFSGEQSHSMAAFPIRAVYMKKDRAIGDAPIQLLVSVSKRRFKHAVDRNRIKRQLREAYRLHKQTLLEAVPQNEQLLLALIWLSDRHSPSAEVEKRVVSLIYRLAEKEAKLQAKKKWKH